MARETDEVICAHCQLQALTLRSCGKLMGATGFQYALALFDTAVADGLTVEQMADVLRSIEHARRQPVDGVVASAISHMTMPHTLYPH